MKKKKKLKLMEGGKVKKLKKKSKSFDVSAVAEKITKGKGGKKEKREIAVAADLDVVKHIKKMLKKEGMDLDDLRTENQLRRTHLKTKGRLYICAVTEDCPAEYITAGGFDFPKFIQPINNRTRRSRMRSQRLSARPQKLKRMWLDPDQITKILKSAREKWLTISVPGEAYDEDDGYATDTVVHDKVRAIYFLVIHEVKADQADPDFGTLKPVVKRPRHVRSVVNASMEVDRLISESGAIKKKGNKIVHDIEKSRFVPA